MNLQSIAAPLVAAVTPLVSCLLEVSTGSTKDAASRRTPTYSAPVTVQGQVQSLTFGDLRQLDGLNLNGTKRAIYLTGNVEGVVRSANKGGDKITMPDGTVWLVAMVLESWLQNLNNGESGWCKVAVTLQDGS